jgi:hypothetical protein
LQPSPRWRLASLEHKPLAAGWTFDALKVDCSQVSTLKEASWDRGISGQHTRLLATKFPFARSESRRTPISALGLFLVFRWFGRSIANSHGGHLWQVPMWRRHNFSFHFADRDAVVIASGYLVLGAGHTRLWLVDRCEYRVGIFPKFKEFFVRFAGGCVVAHQSLCPTELKPGQWAGDKFPALTGVVDQLLELARC